MNKYKGEVTGKLGDKERTFKLTFEAIVNIEAKTGKSIIEVTQNMSIPKYSFKDLITILHEGLKGAGSNVVQSAVGDMVIQTGILKSSELAGKILATAFTGEEDESSPLAKAESNQTDTQSNNT